jgi:hypothetical protein
MELSFKNESLSKILLDFLKPDGCLFQIMMHQHNYIEREQYRLPLSKLSVRSPNFEL